MNETLCHALWRGSAEDDNLVGAATGHCPDGEGPRRDLMAIHVVGRAANALILGLVSCP